MTADVWSRIATERVALADELAGLSDAQWDTPSLCEGWSARVVAAHLSAAFVVSTPAVVGAIVRHGFRFERANDALARRLAARQTGPESLAVVRANAASHWHPPGLGPQAPLTDVVVHGQDIRRPLGLARDFPADTLRTILEFVTGGRTFGFVPRRRLAGLRFAAADFDWSFGAGPEVRGPGEALVLAMLGRTAALADLEGDGVEQLHARTVHA